MLRGGFYYIDCEGFNFTSNNREYNISYDIYKDIIKTKKALFITNFKVNGKQYPATPVYSYLNAGTQVINNTNSFKCRFMLFYIDGSEQAKIVASNELITNY